VIPRGGVKPIHWLSGPDGRSAGALAPAPAMAQGSKGKRSRRSSVSRLGATARRAVSRVYLLLLVAALPACATALAVGRGGPVYEIRVATVNGVPTSLRGPSTHPACVLQVGNRVAQVWLAAPEHYDRTSPVVFEADAEALKDGILVERSWNEAVVHQVTDGELSAGAAVVYVPGNKHPTTVELRFDPISRLSRSDRQNELAKHRPGLEQPVGGGDVR
jgi:hypothetical protein